MNDNEIQAKSKLKTFGEFWINGVQFILTEPVAGQILTFTAVDKVENTTSPTLNPYTSFVLNPTTKKLETYKSGVLVENLDFPALFVTDTELTTILSGYATVSSLKETFKIHLNIGNGEDIATRLVGLVEGTDYPEGWILSAGVDPKDLVVNHGLGRDLCDVTVFSLESGTSKRKRIDSLGYVGLFTTDTNEFTIESVAQVSKELDIYIRFV